MRRDRVARQRQWPLFNQYCGVNGDTCVMEKYEVIKRLLEEEEDDDFLLF